MDDITGVKRKRFYVEYLERVQGVMSQFTNYSCPIVVNDEYEIIIRETSSMLKDLLFNEDFVSLQSLTEYLQKQKKHLISIKSKTSTLIYEQISTLVVIASLFRIEESIVLFNFKHNQPKKGTVMYYNPVNERLCSILYNSIWNAIKCLDGFAMSYKFKYDVYDNKREEIREQCHKNNTDTRTSSEKNKDIAVCVAEETGSCLIQILIGCGIVALLAMIFAK